MPDQVLERCRARILVQPFRLRLSSLRVGVPLPGGQHRGHLPGEAAATWATRVASSWAN